MKYINVTWTFACAGTRKEECAVSHLQHIEIADERHGFGSRIRCGFGLHERTKRQGVREELHILRNDRLMPPDSGSVTAVIGAIRDSQIRLLRECKRCLPKRKLCLPKRKLC